MNIGWPREWQDSGAATDFEGVDMGKRTCSVDECGRVVVAHTLCGQHNRQRTEGKPFTAIRSWRPQTERDGVNRKFCRYCEVWLDESEFGRSTRNPDGLSYICKKFNVDKHLLANYGVTRSHYNDILSSQGGGCAICGLGCSSGRNLAVDHDHSCCPTPGKSCGKCVRGLLCGNCNHGVGTFQDDPAVLRAAVDYLERHGK